MDWWLVTFFIGAIFSLLLPIAPAFFYVLLFILCFLLAYFNRTTRPYCALFLGCAWMLLIASIYQHIWSANNLNPVMLSNQVVTVVGEVNSIPHCKNNRCRFNFIAEQLNGKTLLQPLHIRLNWNTPNLLPKQGQQWLLFVKLKPAHGLANPGGFSYQTWLRRYNIHATGYVRNKKAHRLIKNVINHRQQQFLNFNTVLPVHDLSAIIQALTFGERSGLNKSHWKVLQHTQIQHLIAISGLHIGIVGGFSYFFILMVIRCLPLEQLLSTLFFRKKIPHIVNCCLNSNVRILALVLSACCSGYYAYLAGFSVPTLRALVMIYCFLLFRLMAIKISLLSWLTLSLLLIILLTPMSVISMSFWLSIYAVLSIFFILWCFKKHFNNNLAAHSLLSGFTAKSRQLLLLQVILTLLMLPLATLLSGQISLVAILANIVAVPLVSFIILPLSICALLISTFSSILATFVIEIVLFILSRLWYYLAFLSELPWAVVNLSQIQWVFISIAIVFILLAFVIIPKQRKWFLLPLVLATANILLLDRQPARQWVVNVMDVGHGLAVIVEKNHRVLLYDTGASYPSGFSMAESVLLPYFQQQGIKQIDWLIMSHDDNDHAGGFNQLNKQLMIENVMSNDITIDAKHRCLAGARFHWQQLTIDILSPSEIKAANNDDSCVMRISDQQHSVLLTGDISQKIEKRLVRVAKSKMQLNSHNYLNADILIAPHHGSKTSSSNAFIKAVSPQYAIFSTGFLNHWMMPAKTVVERYHKLNIRTFNTANSGMLTFTLNDKDIAVKRYRFDDWPYWFAN